MVWLNVGSVNTRTLRDARSQMMSFELRHASASLVECVLRFFEIRRR